MSRKNTGGGVGSPGQEGTTAHTRLVGQLWKTHLPGPAWLICQSPRKKYLEEDGIVPVSGITCTVNTT